MGQLILSIHAGSHDAAAAVFEDYSLRAAVSLERLTRLKNDGRSYPDACIDEVLGIIGASRQDVDVIVWNRSEFPTRYYKTIRGVRWIREQYRRHGLDRGRAGGAARAQPVASGKVSGGVRAERRLDARDRLRVAVLCRRVELAISRHDPPERGKILRQH
jgi:predicted NodU family carbamoyl transferase